MSRPGRHQASRLRRRASKLEAEIAELQAQLNAPKPVFYSYVQLAELWHLHPGSIKRWVSCDRKRGLRVVTAYRFTPQHQRREALILEEDAIALFHRHCPGLSAALASRPSR